MPCWRARFLLALAPCVSTAACSLIVNTNGLVGSAQEPGADASLGPDATDPISDASITDSSDGSDALAPGKIVVGATSTGNTAGTAAIPIALPTGAMTGDTLVASVFAGNKDATAACVITPAFAWTQVARVDHGIVGTLAIYTHVVDGTEPAMTSFGITSGSSGVAWITDYRGVAVKSPVDDTNGADLGTSMTTYDAPAVQARHAGDLVLVAWGGYAAGATPMFTPPSQLTTRAALTNGGSRGGAGGDTLTLMAGTTSVYTATAAPAPDYALAVTVALVPGP